MENPFENYNNVLKDLKDTRWVQLLGSKRKEKLDQSICDDLKIENQYEFDIKSTNLIFKKMFIVYCATLTEELLKDYFCFHKRTKGINNITDDDYKYDLKYTFSNMDKFDKDIWTSFVIKSIGTLKGKEDIRISYADACSIFPDSKYLLYNYGLRNIIIHNNGTINKKTYEKYPICAIDTKPTIENGFIDLLRTYLLNFNSFLNDTFKL